LVVAVAVWTPDPVTVGSASAAATLIDGDTLKFGHERIRLHGIDAPKSQQRCVDDWQAGYTEVGRSPRQHGAAHDARVHQPQDQAGAHRGGGSNGLARKCGITVVEDAAKSLRSFYHGRRLGVRS
jgi:hypothetical protein